MAQPYVQDPDLNPAGCCTERRRFLSRMLAMPLIGMLPTSVFAGEPDGGSCRDTRALLISATTVAGRKSLEHAEEELRELFGGVSRILLINFASLPDDRDAYAARMQRDFTRIDPRFTVDSLHRVAVGDAERMVRDAEAVYVNGGNTFLLLKELYDRSVVALLRERVLSGIPYAGSSAGSNIGGVQIGTTNDFPLVDVPTRRALGLMPACYNPHHPDRADKKAYGSRQYKIHQYCRYHPEETVIGVNNHGMIRIRGASLSLRGHASEATIQIGDQSAFVSDQATGSISLAIQKMVAARSSAAT